MKQEQEDRLRAWLNPMGAEQVMEVFNVFNMFANKSHAEYENILDLMTRILLEKMKP